MAVTWYRVRIPNSRRVVNSLQDGRCQSAGGTGGGMRMHGEEF